MKDVKAQAPKAICELEPTNVSTNLIINRDKPPFDNADLRQAMALALDRKAFVDILFEGQADIGGALLPPPAGVWGLPPDMLKTVPGYGPDVKKNRDEARKHHAEARLRAGQAARRSRCRPATSRAYRDPAVILIDQLKEIYIDGELDVVDTGMWFAKVARKDYAVGLNLTGNGIDDPDQALLRELRLRLGAQLHRTTATRTSRSCSTSNRWRPTSQKRKKLVWEIDRKLPGGRGAADPLSLAHGDLLAALREEHDHHGQQLLQRLPLRGRVAGQVSADGAQLAPPHGAASSTQRRVCEPVGRTRRCIDRAGCETASSRFARLAMTRTSVGSEEPVGQPT